MNDLLKEIVVWATEGALAIVIIGHIRLWFAHFKLREEIARDYVKRSDLSADVDALDRRMQQFQVKVEKDMEEMRKTTTRILELVAEIRGATNAAAHANG